MKKLLLKLIVSSILLTPFSVKADLFYYIGFSLILFDDSLAIKSLKKSCMNGDYRGCLQLGYALERKGNPMDAIKIYTDSCLKKSEINCLALGNFYRNHNFTLEAEKIYKKACALSSGKACYNYYEMIRGKTNIEESLSVLNQSCNLGYGISCYTLSNYLKELHKPFVESLKKACFLDQDQACDEYRELIGGGNIEKLWNQIKNISSKIKDFFY